MIYVSFICQNITKRGTGSVFTTAQRKNVPPPGPLKFVSVFSHSCIHLAFFFLDSLKFINMESRQLVVSEIKRPLIFAIKHLL